MEGPTGASQPRETSTHASLRRVACLALALVLAASLAGCLAGDGGRDLDFSSYAEARAAEGNVYAPAEDGLATRLKLIDPLEPREEDKGQQRFLVLLYDAGRDAPQREANLRIEAHHLGQDRGTSPERDPRSQEHGVYEGFTTLDATGEWTVTIEATLPGGQTATFRIPVHVR